MFTKEELALLLAAARTCSVISLSEGHVEQTRKYRELGKKVEQLLLDFEPVEILKVSNEG
jgi:hypothetical protein